MIKKLIVPFVLLISLTALAQEGTSSPYSYYGIGDLKFKGTIENKSMGSISVFPDSTHVNLQNPAQLASLKLTGFTVGGTYLNSKSYTETQREKARRTALDYLAVGLPLGKLGIGFGLIPYSSVGYKIERISTNPNSITDTIASKYNGIGGVNKVFVGFGYKLTKKINFGADVQYNFGTIETDYTRFEKDGTNVIQNGTKEKNVSELHGVNVDFGLTYQSMINKKLSFFGSLTYTPQSNLKVSNARTIQIIQSNGSSISVIESQNITVDDVSIKMPSKLSIGSGFGEVKKWLLGGEITYSNTSVITNRFNDIDGAGFKNSMKYSLGGYFIPNYNSYSSYFKKITYRAGMRYEQTGLVIQNKSINDFAGNIGLGLPLGNGFSSVNIGLEVGKRGTKYNNLVEENYVNLSVGLSLTDKWFVKRKFD